MGQRRRPVLDVFPLTPDRWGDFTTLFGSNGACGGCWCMLWRVATRAAFDAGKGDGNRDALKAIVDAGEPPGLLAYDGDAPVGWCSVGPRDDFPGLGRSRVLKAADDTPVWAVTCLFVRKTHRGRGVSVELLKAAGRYVAGRGGSVVEGYPVEPKADPMPAAFAWTGLASAFLRAGFTEHRRGSPTRPIMRLVVGPVGDEE